MASKTKRIRPKFYAIEKDFNNGKLVQIDVLEHIFNGILTKSGKLNKKFKFFSMKYYGRTTINSRETLYNYMLSEFIYNYWGKCEREVVIVDWPYRDKVEDSRPHKIDVYYQLKMNMDVIVDLVWNYIKEDLEND